MGGSFLCRGLFYNVGHTAAHKGDEGFGRHLDLITDLSSGDDDVLNALSAFMKDGFEGLFHADGGASAAHIPSDSVDILDVDHLNGFFTCGPGGFL